jgi:hypothetical protein
VLNLAGNTLKDIKVNGLIEMLRMDECSLSSLDVSNNPLSGAMVMRSLKFNASLEYLNVRGTELDDTGVRDFGALLFGDFTHYCIKAQAPGAFDAGAGVRTRPQPPVHALWLRTVTPMAARTSPSPLVPTSAPPICSTSSMKKPCASCCTWTSSASPAGER